MKRSIFHPTYPVAAVAICLAGICSVASVNLQANDIQVGRYSLFAATPTEAWPCLTTPDSSISITPSPSPRL